MFRNGFVFRSIGILLLIGLLTAGGFVVYKAGVTQGIVQSPAVAIAISKAAESGQPVQLLYGYPYGWRFPHHFGFFPLGGICLSIFFLFLIFGLLRMIFLRPWRHAHLHGPWGRRWEEGIPSVFNEWHKRAHGEKPAEEKPEEK